MWACTLLLVECTDIDQHESRYHKELQLIIRDPVFLVLDFRNEALVHS